MKNKVISFGIAYVLVIAAFFGFITFGPGIVSAAGMTFYVDDDNVAGPWDGSMANPYQTINDAIAAATDGDTIYVFNGTYVENVVVDKSLTIIGNGTGNTTIDGGWGVDVVRITANMVNITGFTILNGNNGIYLDSSSNSTISNNNVTDIAYGIYLKLSMNNNITSNNVSNSAYGIWVTESDDNIITNNNITENEFGIYLRYSLNCQIMGNDFIRGGVLITGGSQVSYFNSHNIPTDNLVNGNPLYYYKDVSGFDIDGIPVGQVILANCSNVNVRNLDINYTNVGIELAFTHDSNITGNNMSNGYYGFFLQASSNNNIASNNISNSQYSIYLYGCSNIDVSSNMIVDARYGIYFTDSALGNIIGNDVSSSINHGIYLLRTSSSNIIGNDVYMNNRRGIYLSSSSDNNIIGNNISSNGGMGVEVYSSSNANISGNTFFNDGLFFWGGTMPHFNSHTVPTSNMVNGKPLYYYKDMNNLVIDGTTMGQLILANCNDADVRNLEINDTDVGIQVAYSLNASVSSNHIFDNDFGLYYSYSDHGTISNNEVESHDSTAINMFYSENNLITGNNVTSNSGFGIYLSFSHYNNATENNASGNIEGMDIFQSNGNTVANNTLNNNIQYGIYMHNNCEDNTIIDNTVQRNDYGIYLGSSANNNFVINNTATYNSGVGIVLSTVVGETIISNNLSNNPIGLNFADSQFNTITDNTITQNSDYGVYMGGGSTSNTFISNTFANNDNGIFMTSSSDENTITNSDFNNNTVYAIYMESCDSNILTNNKIKDNMNIGIFLFFADNNSITSNDIINNTDYAIILLTSYNNSIHHNNIAYNRGSNDTYNSSAIQASDDGSNFWDSSSKGNWWADWTIPDIVAPFGIVDNPYVLDGGSEQDDFPLVNPTEAVPPTISNLQPSSGVTLLVSTTIIAANYTDAAGINESSVMMDVDGYEVTSFSTVGPDGIFYDPGTPFADGTHTINLSVADIHDNIAFVSWTFTVDTTPPSIFNKRPLYDSVTSDNMTTINASYSDSSGIDTGKVKMFLNGNDETSNATVTPNNITYIPITPLADGDYTVEIQVTDLAGLSTGQWWPFTVDAIPPVIFNMLPINGTTLSINITTIAANYTDSAEINVNSVVLKINGGNVTTSAIVTPEGVTYTPLTGLTDGTYMVNLEVKNIYDNPANATWYFTIDTTAPEITNLEPADATTTSDNTAAISANYTDLSGIDVGSVELIVDGVDETLSATVTADGISFSPALPWTEGTHTVELMVNDTLSNAATLIWSFEVDTTPPEAITDLTASDPTTDSINLTWTAPGDDGDVGTATEYVVKYSTTGAITEGNWNSASTYSQSWTPLAAGETETYSISGLDPDTQYWFAIRALDEISNVADPSNSPEATTLVVQTAPTAPENLDLTWGDSYIHLKWEAPSDYGNSPITNYIIYRGTSSGSITFLDEIGNVLLYNDTTAENGIKYYYKVSAKNTVGEGPQTSQKSATPATIPSAPQNVQASAGVGYVEITWDAPSDDGGYSITHYLIYRGNTSGGTSFLIQLGKVLLYNDTDVEEGVTYYYVVRAKNSLGEGVEPSEVSGTPTGPPNVLPTSGITSLSSGQVLEGTVTISGTASDPEGTLARVEIRIDDGAWIEVTGTDTWSHNLDTTTLSNGDHTISIRSYDGEDYSDEDSITIEVANPKPKEDKTLFEEAWFFPLIIVVIIIIVLVLLMAMRKKAPGEGMPEEEDIPPEEAPGEEVAEEAAEEPAGETGEEPMEEEAPAEEPDEDISDKEVEEELVEEETPEETPSTDEPVEESEGGEPEATEEAEETREQ